MKREGWRDERDPGKSPVHLRKQKQHSRNPLPGTYLPSEYIIYTNLRKTERKEEREECERMVGREEGRKERREGRREGGRNGGRKRQILGRQWLHCGFFPCFHPADWMSNVLGFD